MIRRVRPDQARRILELADQLGREVVEQAREDLKTLTTEVAKFYVDTLSDDLRRASGKVVAGGPPDHQASPGVMPLG